MKFTVVHMVTTRCTLLHTYLYTSKAHLHIVLLCVNVRVRTNTRCLKRNRRWPHFAGALVCSLRRDLATSRAERHVTRNGTFLVWRSTRTPNSVDLHEYRDDTLLSYPSIDRLYFMYSSVPLTDPRILPREQSQFARAISVHGLQSASFAAQRDRWVIHGRMSASCAHGTEDRIPLQLTLLVPADTPRLT